MINQSNHTLSFVFDNQADQLLLLQIAEEGALKRKHTGLKGAVDLMEGINESAIRNIRESSGLLVTKAVLRGVVKTIYRESQSAIVYFIYESTLASGELTTNPSGRLKWVDILNIFNLPLESIALKIMPFLLDGESFFEGTLSLNSLDEVESCELQICNSI